MSSFLTNRAFSSLFPTPLQCNLLHVTVSWDLGDGNLNAVVLRCVLREWCTYPQVGERPLQQGSDAVQARGGLAALSGGLGPELLYTSLWQSEGQGLPPLLQLTLLIGWGLHRDKDI